MAKQQNSTKALRRTSLKAGDLVSCIDDAPCRCGNCGAIPVPYKRGDVFRVERTGKTNGKPSIWLVGVPNDDQHDGENVTRFRKIVPASDDFTMMLRSLSRSKRENA